jgi:hypothetical protein
MPKRAVMRASQAALSGVLLLGCGLVLADEEGEEAPDMEFLEYLGYWEESDEEWLMFEGPVTAELEERNDPAPQGEESTETEDES